MKQEFCCFVFRPLSGYTKLQNGTVGDIIINLGSLVDVDAQVKHIFLLQIAQTLWLPPGTCVLNALPQFTHQTIPALTAYHPNNHQVVKHQQPIIPSASQYDALYGYLNNLVTISYNCF